MGLLPLTYTRPAHVAKDVLRRSQTSVASSELEKTSLRSGKSGVTAGIPNALSFDQIISGGTCPPMTIRDFMNYLIYVEHSAENLQFYLWHQEYVARFKEADTSDLGLAPEWTSAMEDEVAAKLQKKVTETWQQGKTGVSEVASEMFKGTDFEKGRADSYVTETNPFTTPPRSPGGHADDDSTSAFSSELSSSKTYRSQASDAFISAGVKVPFSIQPFREEIDRIIATYIMDGSPRQLNLSDRDQKAVLHALSYTTHPSALRTAFRVVEHTLRRQGHPNFVRWSTHSANPSRISFARTFGLSGVIGAFIVAIILTLSSVSRGWRAMAAIGWVLGISAVVASYRGMCICMYTLSTHHHHIYPWELFINTEEPEEMGKRSFDSFGSKNSFEQEPWVVKYAERGIVRKIFDREAWIQEPALRQVQDIVFIQSTFVGLLSGGFLTAIFLSLPAGHFF